MDNGYNGFGRYGQADGPRYGGFGQVNGDDGRARDNGDGRSRNGGTYDEAHLREDMARYGSMSGDELTEELFSKAREMRAEGKLDTDMLEDFASKAAPFLSAAELKRLRELISMLKNV